jgi:hypothetical protein
MNPLPPFALLATDVDHQHFMIPEIEARFGDADCTSPAVNDVLLVGDIVWIKESLEIREIVIQTVGREGERSGRPKSTLS